MEHATIPTYLEPQWLVLLFAVLWLAVSGLQAHRSGWRTLARRFPAPAQLEGERFRFATGSVGAGTWSTVTYLNCLFVTVGHAGIGLSLLLPFRFLSPPLLVPWEQVESVQETKGRFGSRAVVRFNDSAVKLTLFGPAASSVLAAHPDGNGWALREPPRSR